MTNMEQLLNTLRELISKSPLGYIKGNCRLAKLDSTEWSRCPDDESFFTHFSPARRTIPFAVNNMPIGEAVVGKEIIIKIRTDDKHNLSMFLAIKRDEYTMIIHIYCLFGFPGLQEFAEFIAHVEES